MAEINSRLGKFYSTLTNCFRKHAKRKARLRLEKAVLKLRADRLPNFDGNWPLDLQTQWYKAYHGIIEDMFRLAGTD